MNAVPLPFRQRDIHEPERRMAQVISILALGLMLAGFGGELAFHGNPAFPGPPAVTPQVLALAPVSPFLLCMSAGILLFAVLPALRVLLALLEYARRRDWRNALIAIVVLLELAGSAFLHRVARG